jgi:hypothetical protein
MEAKELRIGNLISANYVYEGQVKTFERFNDTLNVVFFSDGKPNGIGEYLYDVKPIPLTEEWLLKFGFEWDDVETKTNGGTEKMLLKDILLMKRHQDTLWVACPYGYLISPHRTLYVHQLQNLYFALTGEELTIKNQD